MGELTTGVWINDVPVEFAAPFELRLSRGHEPWRAEIPVSDDRFDDLDNPITIRFRAPDDRGNMVETEWQGWHIVQKATKDEGLYSLIVADGRWRAEREKITVSYNIRWWGEVDSYQQHSLNDGQPWLAYDAIKDALERFGLELEDNPYLPQAVKNVVLPDNISISEGGGFRAASMAEVMPRLLETIRCDMVWTPSGKIMIVDRSSKEAGSENLLGYRAIGGRAGVRDNSWSRPEKVVLLFARRLEVALEYDEEELFRGTSSGGDFYELPKQEVEMVIPRIDFDAIDNLGLNPLFENISHDEWYDVVSDVMNKNRAWALKHMMKPRLFPFEANAAGNKKTAEQFFREQIMESLMKETYRRRFRVKKIKVGDTELTRKVADLQMGRVQPDGTTKSEANVFMDYVRINRFSQYPPGKGPTNGGSVFDAQFSDNIAFNEDVPAPFEASWITAEVADLMFEVSPLRKRLLDVEYWPGQLEESLRYGDIQDIVAGQPLGPVESTMELDGEFRMRVITHGLLIDEVDGVGRDYELDVTDLAGFIGKLDEPELRKDRFGPPLYIRVDDMTVNHEYDGTFPGRINNAALLVERAEHVAKEINQTYKAARFGAVTYEGIESIVNGVTTNGDLFDTVVQVGYDAPHTITTTYMIMPEIRSIRGNRDEYGSVPVPVIG